MLTYVTLAMSTCFLCWATSGQAGDAVAGQTKAAMCFSCHGATGVSMLPTYPNLAGQKEQYIIKQLSDFKTGKRSDPTMSVMAKTLTDADVADVAAYFSGLPAIKYGPARK